MKAKKTSGKVDDDDQVIMALEKYNCNIWMVRIPIASSFPEKFHSAQNIVGEQTKYFLLPDLWFIVKTNSKRRISKDYRHCTNSMDVELTLHVQFQYFSRKFMNLYESKNLDYINWILV